MTEFALNFGRQGSNYPQSILQGYNTVTGSYNLSTTHCTPDSGEANTLQILTHGVGFDRSYWDLPFNNFDNSYVTTAIDLYGHSTLSWDRLGIGASSHGEPLVEIQAPLEQAALAALTKHARDGSLPNTSGHKYSKIIHIGHSLGAVLSYALARDDHSASDGLILQSWSMNQTFFPYFSLGGNWIPVTDLTSAYRAGYLAAGDQAAFQTNFLAPGQFDPDILSFAYKNGHPVAIGELLTVGDAMYGINQFTGPVMIVTGERDLPFCGGDCYATGDPRLSSIPAAAKNFFPKAKEVNVTIVPYGGHGLNLEYQHGQMYQAMNQFLETHGLGSGGMKGY